jgi:hypothetical protein
MEKTQFNDLQKDTLLLIFSLCDSPLDLLRCACVSKKFEELSSDDIIWRRVYLSHFNPTPALMKISFQFKLGKVVEDSRCQSLGR